MKKEVLPPTLEPQVILMGGEYSPLKPRTSFQAYKPVADSFGQRN